MNIFIPTLNQIAYLFLLIILGYVLVKIKILPDISDSILSRLENFLFIPALVLSTFMTNFTIEKISVYSTYFLAGFIVSFFGVLLAIILAKILFKSRKIYAYGIAFSNFGFMGNAVVLALFPDLFTEYLIFVLPFWFFVYIWGVPLILSGDDNKKIKMKSRLKSLLNPMVIAMVVGIILGVVNLKLPVFINATVSSLGSLMTPIAMIITGITIAKIDLLKVIKNFSVYFLSIIRLIIIPLITIFLLMFMQISYELKLCILFALAMPLGLNSIIVLNAYGYDTTEASGMALISHALSLVTIPLIFSIFSYLI